MAIQYTPETARRAIMDGLQVQAQRMLPYRPSPHGSVDGDAHQPSRGRTRNRSSSAHSARSDSSRKSDSSGRTLLGDEDEDGQLKPSHWLREQASDRLKEPKGRRGARGRRERSLSKDSEDSKGSTTDSRWSDNDWRGRSQRQQAHHYHHHDSVSPPRHRRSTSRATRDSRRTSGASKPKSRLNADYERAGHTVRKRHRSPSRSHTRSRTPQPAPPPISLRAWAEEIVQRAIAPHLLDPSQPSATATSAWGAAARNAVRAGAMAALASHNAPGPWLGPKGTRVATAALCAALVDTYMKRKYPKSVNGVRHTAMRQAAEYAISNMVAEPIMQRAAQRRGSGKGK